MIKTFGELEHGDIFKLAHRNPEVIYIKTNSINPDNNTIVLSGDKKLSYLGYRDWVRNSTEVEFIVNIKSIISFM